MRNIYSHAEEQSQVKLQGAPKTLIAASRTKRNLQMASEIYILAGVGGGQPVPSCKGDGPDIIGAVYKTQP